MKAVCNLVILSALSLLLAPAAMAQSSSSGQGQINNGPSQSDLETSKDRGIIAVPIYPEITPKVPVQSSRNNTPKKVTTARTQGTGSHKPGGQKTGTQKTAPTVATHKVAPTVATHKQPDVQAAVASHSDKPSYQTVSTDNNQIIKAWLNKSGNTPAYQVGERMQVNVAASQDCNLVVFDFDGKGTLTQIFPNQFQQSGTLKAGQLISIGGQDSKFDYEIAGKSGMEKIFIYAYPNTLDNPVTVAFNPPSSSPFRSASMTPSQYLDLVNKSKVFFARDIKIVPKSGTQPASYNTSTAPNKIELPYLIK